MDTVGNRIKELRKTLCFKQVEFAKRVLVSSSYISKVESGKETPSDIFIKLIALEFNISYDWLKNGSGEMNIKNNNSDYFERINSYENMKPIKEIHTLNSSINSTLNRNSTFRSMCFSDMLYNICEIIELDVSDAQKDLIIEILSDYIGSIEELIKKVYTNKNTEDIETKNSFYISSHLKTVEKLFNDISELLTKQGE